MQTGPVRAFSACAQESNFNPCAEHGHQALSEPVRALAQNRGTLPVTAAGAPGPVTLPVSGPDGTVSLANWTLPPQNRWAFNHLRELIPTRTISRGDGFVTELPSYGQMLDDIRFKSISGEECRFARLLGESWTDGVVVLHRGKIVFERCGGGYSLGLQHIAFSMTKSVVGMLAGVLMAQGAFRRSDDVTAFLPELATSGWRESKVDHLLNMTTGADFVEDYEDRDGHVWDIRRILYGLPREGGVRDATTVREYLAGIGRSSPHGRGFTYKSADTVVLTWIMERTTGMRLPELIETHIWSRIGAANDAYIMLGVDGDAYGAGGLCAALHDLARFGLMVQQRGAIGTRQIVPESWIDDTCNGDSDALRSGYYAEWLPGGAYRNHWWLNRRGTGGMLAIGIHGQMIFVDLHREVVAVKLSSWPKARLLDTLVDTLSAFEAVAEQL